MNGAVAFGSTLDNPRHVYECLNAMTPALAILRCDPQSPRIRIGDGRG